MSTISLKEEAEHNIILTKGSGHSAARNGCLSISILPTTILRGLSQPLRQISQSLKSIRYQRRSPNPKLFIQYICVPFSITATKSMCLIRAVQQSKSRFVTRHEERYFHTWLTKIRHLSPGLFLMGYGRKVVMSLLLLHLYSWLEILFERTVQHL